MSRPSSQKTSPIWVAKAHLNYDFFSLSTVAESYVNELAELVGFPFNYKYENLDVFYDQNNVNEHTRRLAADNRLIATHIQFIKQQIRSLLAASARYGKKHDLAALNVWYGAYRAFLPALGVVFGLEQALEKAVREFLSDEEFHSVAFAKETAAAHEQQSILKLALLSPRSARLKKGIEVHRRRYAWLGNKMMSRAPFTAEQISDRVEAARGTAREKLQELRANRRALEEQAAKVLRRLTPKQRQLIRWYQDILFLRTERADAVCRAAELTAPLFAWLGQQLGYSRDDLLRFSYREILNMLKTSERLDPTSRQKYHALFVDGTFQVFWGSWGQESEKLSDVTKLTGTIACMGVARGRVKIVNDLPDVKDLLQNS